jgi:hypothetical protein
MKWDKEKKKGWRWCVHAGGRRRVEELPVQEGARGYDRLFGK